MDIVSPDDLPKPWMNGSCGLVLPDQIKELPERHEPPIRCWPVGTVQRDRHHKPELVPLHFSHLVVGNPRLERQQVLLVDPGSFGQHLTPSPLQRRLDAQHGKEAGVERRIVILG